MHLTLLLVTTALTLFARARAEPVTIYSAQLWPDADSRHSSTP